MIEPVVGMVFDWNDYGDQKRRTIKEIKNGKIITDYSDWGSVTKFQDYVSDGRIIVIDELEHLKAQREDLDKTIKKLESEKSVEKMLADAREALKLLAEKGIVSGWSSERRAYQGNISYTSTVNYNDGNTHIEAKITRTK